MAQLRERRESTSEEPLLELDAELKTLNSKIATRFLLSQGIITTEAFLSTESATMSNALIECRKLWDSNDECSIMAARACISFWKKRLSDRRSSISGGPPVELDAELKTLSLKARQFLSSQGIATAEAFLSSDTATTVNALMDWRKRGDLSKCSAQACITEWKRSLRERREPLIEVDDELKTLSRQARSFLLSQGITTAEAFLSTNTTTTANELMDWRKQSGARECSLKLAKHSIYKWKRSLPERHSIMPVEPLEERDTDELKKLSKKARDFLSSQGITTAEGFLSTNTNTTGDALLNWRKRCDSKYECSVATARHCIAQWKRELRNHLSRTPREPLIELAAELKTAGKTTEDDDDASNDCFSDDHGESMSAEPRDDSNEQNPGSKKRKRPHEELSSDVRQECWV
jgi:hypothetical protein